jgi:peptidyl-prolyl cis-trans isomerase B (cyclophilin B)
LLIVSPNRPRRSPQLLIIKRDNKVLKPFILTFFCLIIFAASAKSQTESASTETQKSGVQTSKKANSRRATKPAPIASSELFEKASVETMAAQCVKFETETGLLEFELFPESAPETVRNFLNLIAKGAFDATTFSRVVPDFIVQGGDLFTREKITPELSNRSRRTIPDEPSQIKHERGILSMARPDEPNSATTHFFILVREAKELDGKYAAFGRVRIGMEVVDAINKMRVEGDQPVKPVRLTRATLFRCPT